MSKVPPSPLLPHKPNRNFLRCFLVYPWCISAHGERNTDQKLAAGYRIPFPPNHKINWEIFHKEVYFYIKGIKDIISWNGRGNIWSRISRIPNTLLISRLAERLRTLAKSTRVIHAQLYQRHARNSLANFNSTGPRSWNTLHEIPCRNKLTHVSGKNLLLHFYFPFLFLSPLELCLFERTFAEIWRSTKGWLSSIPWSNVSETKGAPQHQTDSDSNDQCRSTKSDKLRQSIENTEDGIREKVAVLFPDCMAK